jgi:ketosteroid isomerase-like protein
MKDLITTSAHNWDKAFNSGDINGLAAFYATNAQVIPAGGAPVGGPDAIGAFFADLKSKGFSDHAITVDKVLDLGTTQVAIGKWQLKGPSDGGSKTQYGGNWVNVLSRSSNDWRIVLHIWN